MQPDFDCFGIFGFPGFDGLALDNGGKKARGVAMLGRNMDAEEMEAVVAVVMTIIAAVVVAVTLVKEVKVGCLGFFAVLVSVVLVGILFRPTKVIGSLWAVVAVQQTWVMVMGLGMVTMLVMVGGL